jgi:tetrahydromethanopterin S-methyltransferase subunit D
MLSSRPVGGSPATGWQATSNGVGTVTVYAVCAP